MRAAAILSIIVLLALHAGPGMAHRLNVFAFADGSTIVGSAYFSGGGAPAGAAVKIVGPDGTTLGETVTDDAGAFSFEAEQRANHRIAVETADGHAADFLIAAAEFPLGLPTLDGAMSAPAVAVSETGTREPTAIGGATGSAIDEAALEALVARVVQQQIRPLREQLLVYGDTVRLNDILGGIGYIVGIFGAAAYLLSLRRRQAPVADRTAAE